MQRIEVYGILGVKRRALLLPFSESVFDLVVYQRHASLDVIECRHLHTDPGLHDLREHLVGKAVALDIIGVSRVVLWSSYQVRYVYRSLMIRPVLRYCIHVGAVGNE